MIKKTQASVYTVEILVDSADKIISRETGEMITGIFIIDFVIRDEIKGRAIDELSNIFNFKCTDLFVEKERAGWIKSLSPSEQDDVKKVVLNKARLLLGDHLSYF